MSWAQMPPRVMLTDGSVIVGAPERIVESRRAIGAGVQGHNLELAHVGDAPPTSIPLSEVSQIRYRSESRLVVTSGAGTQCTALAEDEHESLPADWADEGASFTWSEAQTPQVFHRWPHIPDASWVWSDANWSGTAHRERLVFRHTFEIPEDLRITDAVLLVGVDERIEAGRLNGIDLPHGGPGVEQSWNVTHALVPGTNRLALIASDQPDEEAGKDQINAAGLAFRLEIEGVPGAGAATARPTCVANFENGDRLQGHLRRVNDTTVWMDTSLGEVKFDRDWVSELLIQAAEPQGRLSYLSQPSETRPVIYTLPRVTPTWAPGALLTDGTYVSGRILGVDRGQVMIKPQYSDEALIPIDRVQAIHINPPGETGNFHYPMSNGPRVCRVTLLMGNQLSGLLTEVGDQLRLNTPESDALLIPVDQIVSATFPLSARLWAWKRLSDADKPLGQGIVVWGRRQPRGADLPYEADPVAQIQQIARDFGFTMDWIDDVTLATSPPSPTTRPLLFVVDEREEFPVTVDSPNDGQRALMTYLEGGGTIVLIPSGIPFYHGREWTGHGWNTRTLRQDIPTMLGFNYLLPGPAQGDARAFEYPDSGEQLAFERQSNEGSWSHLPVEFNFPALDDARFRPLLPLVGSQTSEVEPVYALSDAAGTQFGTAMAVVHHTSGPLAGARIYHIAPSLAQAVDETGEPALHRILPAVIADALTADPLAPGGGPQRLGTAVAASVAGASDE
jgi:hypothetical protein